MDICVMVNAPVLYCDDSILQIKLDNKYSFAKGHICTLPFKDCIMDGAGHLLTPYMIASKEDESGRFLYYLTKKDTISMNLPKCRIPGVYIDSDEKYIAQLDAYQQRENEYIFRVLALLHVFKSGNIGTHDTFFEFKFSKGIYHDCRNHKSNNVECNIVDNREFSLSSKEQVACNLFLAEFAGNAYTLLEAAIVKFISAIHSTDSVNVFEQLISTLELLLLDYDQRGRKEVLSKRVAAMLGVDRDNMRELFLRMRLFYKYRSESLHGGDEQQIAKNDVYELEEIFRGILQIYLRKCKNGLSENPCVNWNAIKQKTICDLIKRIEETEENCFAV